MHKIPEIPGQMTHSTVTAWIWGLSLILQITLLITLFSRRIAGSYPLFTNFVGFYLMRSVLLYVTFDYISIEMYGWLYGVLLLLDLVVEACLAAELCSALAQEKGGWNSNRALLVVAAVLVALLGTWLALRLTPRGSIPLDRSQLFFSIVAILIFIASLRSSNDLLRTIAQGWGLFSIISSAADIGRVAAAAGGHPRSYAAWSYALGGAYLVVAFFWLVTLRPLAEAQAPARAKA